MAFGVRSEGKRRRKQPEGGFVGGGSGLGVGEFMGWPLPGALANTTMAIIFTPGQFSRRAEFYQQLGQLTVAGLGFGGGARPSGTETTRAVLPRTDP